MADGWVGGHLLSEVSDTSYLTCVMMRLVGGRKKSSTLWNGVRTTRCVSPTLAWEMTYISAEKNKNKYRQND